MQNLQQTLTEERDKVLQSANQQRSQLEESLHSTKTEEQRLRTKLVEAEEVCWPFVCLFFAFVSSEFLVMHLFGREKDGSSIYEPSVS